MTFASFSVLFIVVYMTKTRYADKPTHDYYRLTYRLKLIVYRHTR